MTWNKKLGYCENSCHLLRILKKLKFNSIYEYQLRTGRAPCSKIWKNLHQFGTFVPIINSIQSFIYLEFIDCSALSEKQMCARKRRVSVRVKMARLICVKLQRNCEGPICMNCGDGKFWEVLFIPSYYITGARYFLFHFLPYAPEQRTEHIIT